MENYTALEPYPKLTVREHINGLTLTTVLTILAAIYVAQSLYTIIYNLHFHPLAHFPGPRLAAATSWYQCWYEVFKFGEFVHKLEELHEQYGACSFPHPLPSVPTDSKQRSGGANHSE